jgi:hypothetical protein
MNTKMIWVSLAILLCFIVTYHAVYSEANNWDTVKKLQQNGKEEDLDKMLSGLSKEELIQLMRDGCNDMFTAADQEKWIRGTLWCALCLENYFGNGPVKDSEVIGIFNLLLNNNDPLMRYGIIRCIREKYNNQLSNEMWDCFVDILYMNILRKDNEDIYKYCLGNIGNVIHEAYTILIFRDPKVSSIRSNKELFKGVLKAMKNGDAVLDKKTNEELFGIIVKANVIKVGLRSLSNTMNENEILERDRSLSILDQIVNQKTGQE